MREGSPINFSTYTNIVVLTGAGISVASGLPTYRGSGSLEEDTGVKKYTSIKALTEDPAPTRSSEKLTVILDA
ncbi:hypothetical protein [Argonema antarcticum]|uniref:hypothetical protein n=1 Tax=Argonema antarcticum TaxID=2942763 RepID=UPI002012737E|nr:hypothetical protein [Argonema antarcticum]MCL1470322.1 hypothetical protein [Argonema antarcticum A004/B2]